MKRAKFTHCTGPIFDCEFPLMRKHIFLLLKSLENVFGTGWVFALEPVTNGGIQIVDWPGREAGMYKTLRFASMGVEDTIHWPWIEHDSIKQWEHSSELIVVCKCAFGTVLRAEGGAPPWTLREVEQWAVAFEILGAVVRRKSLYPKSKYVTCDSANASEEESAEEAYQCAPLRKRARCVNKRLKT